MIARAFDVLVEHLRLTARGTLALAPLRAEELIDRWTVVAS